MSLNKNDLKQIKEAVAEAMVSNQFKETIKGTVAEAMVSNQFKETIKGTVAEAMVSEPIKKVFKETVLEAMEPMMIASQKEFDGIKGRFDKMDERFDKMDERFDKLEKTNTREHEEINLKLDSAAYRFELVALQKRVVVLENKAGIKAARR